MTKSVEFERCIDFLARMIEKYGDEVLQTKTTDERNACKQHGQINEDNKAKEYCA